MTDFVTSVPQPLFGPTGFVLPTETAILVGVQADINTALGGGIDPGLTTPQGQLATTETATISDSQALWAWNVNQLDPLTSSGRNQDALGRIYALTRIPSSPTVQGCTCAGLDGVSIPIGTLAQDQAQNLWAALSTGTITDGSVLINFQCVVSGPVLGPVSLSPYSFVAGWESITPTGDAILGQNVETQAQFEVRREATIAANSIGGLDSIIGNLLGDDEAGAPNVPGILDAYAVENDTSGSLVIGGVSVGGNSIYVSVVGGSSADVAFAIWRSKMPGCGYTGTTTVVVTDPNPQYSPPPPTYNVTFTFAAITAFAVLVTLKNNAQVPSTALTQIQTAIVNAFAGLDGGARAKIGSLVLASRYYADVALLGPWAEIISITLGISGAAASFTASITGTTLNVTAVASGTLAASQLIQDGSALVANGTVIMQQLTGPTGGTGTYQLSISQTIGSESMNATNLSNDVQMTIGQAPAVSAINIALALV